jgi:hypothetical protein
MKLSTQHIVIGGTSLLVLLASVGRAAEPVEAIPAPASAPLTAPDNGFSFAPCDDRCPPNQFWASAEYLLWWVKAQPVPVPLVTIGPPGAVGPSGIAAVLGQPGTQVLMGNQSSSLGSPSGGRFFVGTWLDSPATVGVEAGYFFLAQTSAGQSVSSPATPGSPALSIPFFNAVLGKEDSTGLALPGSYAGTAVLNTTTSLQGAELNGVLLGTRRANWQLNLLGGFRYVNLDENLLFGTSSPFLPPHVPDVFVTQDRFNTNNNFYGGQIGARGLWRYGPWLVSATGKVALGDMHQQIRINGVLYTNDFNNFGAVQTIPGGYFGLPTNSGSFSQDRFAVVPEVNVSIGYRITRRLSFIAGYSFFYLSNVARPGDQIDRVINQSQGTAFTTTVPSSLVGPARPTFLGNTNDFYAHGINLGLTFMY